MRNKKIITTVLAMALVAAVGIGSTLAYFTDKGEKKNTFTMGEVDIEIDEPSFPEDGKIENVKPNQTIAKDPVVRVKEGSLPAYVRAKITYENLSEAQINDIISNININQSDNEMNNKWVLSKDGYYYYQTTLSGGQEAYLFTEVTIPSAWGNELKEFNINVVAEAVQADEFTPEMDNGVIIGWGNVNPETN